MNADDLKKRTKQFALRVLKLVAALPNTVSGRAFAGRAACRGRSLAEFIAKMGTTEEEADESAYWMEVIIEGELLPRKQVEPLLAEAEELTRIFAQSRISASRKVEKTKQRTSNRQSAIGNRQ